MLFEEDSFAKGSIYPIQGRFLTNSSVPDVIFFVPGNENSSNNNTNLIQEGVKVLTKAVNRAASEASLSIATNVVAKANKEEPNIAETIASLLMSNPHSILNTNTKHQQGIVIKSHSVQPNCLYQILLHIDIICRLGDAIAEEEHKDRRLQELAPQLRVFLRTTNWTYELPNLLTASKPIIVANVFIPEHISIIEISLLIETPTDIMLPYELKLHQRDCKFSLLSDCQVLQSISLSKSDFAFCNSRQLYNSTLSISELQWTTSRSFVEHSYLLHLSTTPFYYHQLVLQFLYHQGISPEIISLPSMMTSTKSALLHDTRLCSTCYIKQEKQKQQQKQQHQQQSLTENIDLLIKTLEHAEANNFDSILMLQDDVVPHKEWVNVWKSMQHTLPANWNVLLLGANYFSDSSSQQVKVGIAPLASENAFSCFAIAFNGKHVIRNTLATFQSLRKEQKLPLIFIHEKLLSLYPTSSFVLFPNIVSLHPKHSSLFQLLQQNKNWNNNQVMSPMFCNNQQDFHCLFVNPSSNILSASSAAQLQTVHILLLSASSTILNQAVSQSIQNQTYPNVKLYQIVHTQQDEKLYRINHHETKNDTNNVEIANPRLYFQRLNPLDVFVLWNPTMICVDSRIDLQYEYLIKKQSMVSQDDNSLEDLDEELSQVNVCYVAGTTTTKSNTIDHENGIPSLDTLCGSIKTLSKIPDILTWCKNPTILSPSWSVTTIPIIVGYKG